MFLYFHPQLRLEVIIRIRGDHFRVLNCVETNLLLERCSSTLFYVDCSDSEETQYRYLSALRALVVVVDAEEGCIFIRITGK